MRIAELAKWQEDYIISMRRYFHQHPEVTGKEFHTLEKIALELACIRPEWFAAIMPVCGGGICWFASRLTEIPVRTFHGLLDTVVDPIDSLQMAKAVNTRGGHCELILFPELDHNCWDTVYTTEENYDWLLSHTLHAKEAEAETLSGEIYG